MRGMFKIREGVSSRRSPPSPFSPRSPRSLSILSMFSMISLHSPTNSMTILSFLYSPLFLRSRRISTAESSLSADIDLGVFALGRSHSRSFRSRSPSHLDVSRHFSAGLYTHSSVPISTTRRFPHKTSVHLLSLHYVSHVVQTSQDLEWMARRFALRLDRSETRRGTPRSPLPAPTGRNKPGTRLGTPPEYREEPSSPARSIDMPWRSADPAWRSSRTSRQSFSPYLDVSRPLLGTTAWLATDQTSRVKAKHTFTVSPLQ